MPMKPGMMRLVPALLLVLLTACALAAAGLVLGFLNALHPAFDSLAHFRLHLAAAVALCGVVLLGSRFRRGGLAAIALAALAFAATPGTVLDSVAGNRANAAVAPQDRAVYRLLHLNARFDNGSPERFLSLIARLRPDVVTVNEVSVMWRQRLETLAAAYPHRIVCDSTDIAGGVAILSRRPFTAGIVPDCSEGGSLAVASVDFAGQAVSVSALHLNWPWPYDQADEVGRIAPRLAALPEAALLTGDFNAVRWSDTVRRVAEAGRLEDAGPVGPSWLPRALPDALRRSVGLGIDHVLAGPGVVVTRVERAADAGSDHLPVVTEFWVPSLAAPEADGSRVVLDRGVGAPSSSAGS